MAKLGKVKYIIIHHSASSKTTTVADIRKWHIEKGWSDIGYHKVNYQDGTVHQGRSDAVIGAQAFGANAFSLGFCNIGNFDVEEMNDKQFNSMVQTCAVLCKRYGLTEMNIICHSDVAKMFNVPAGASNCPGKNLRKRMGELRAKVKKYL